MKIAFDFETWKIRPGLQLPPAVCMSWAEIDGVRVGRSGVVTATEGVTYLGRWLDAGAAIIGANTAFDALVSLVKASMLSGSDTPTFFSLLRSWVTAYESGRVHDVFVRQKLLNLAQGTYKWETRPDGKFTAARYNLATIAQKLSGRQLSKNDGEDDDEHWRLRFGELEGLPISAYPKEAYDYALEDAIATAETFIAQERVRTTDKRITRNFPGRDPFFDEQRQTMACVPLKAMSAIGLRTDAAAVERLVEEIQDKIVDARADLVAEGLVRQPAYHRNTDKIVQHIRSTGQEHFFRQENEVKLCKANYTSAGLTSNDALLLALANWKENLPTLVAAGLVDVEHSRDTKVAAKRCADAYAALGKAAPRTDAYDAEKHGELDCISLDADACSGSEDPLLVVYSEYQSLAKTLSNDVPMLRGGAYMPVHTRFEELKETGRTSSSKPNVQNVRRLPGIRECFMPRPGNVFIDCDFGSLELHTLAQVCKWALGFSTLGEALNAGRDPHLEMAAKILGIDYATAKARREAGDSEVDNARVMGKCVNFGRPGGLGVDTFVVYAWTNYRIRITREKAAELLHTYDSTWVEMPNYFRWIKSFKDPYSAKKVIDKKTKEEREIFFYNVVQPWSGRLRAGASYTAACNQPFQGLGSDVAKMALWLYWKATIGLSELGDSDPLFGCLGVNFVHDSIMTEAARARAHEAAIRQKEVMDQAGRVVLPDYPVKADMLVTEQWSKKAQQTREACGACGADGKCKCGTWATRRLVPWDMRVAIRKDLSGFVNMGPAKQAATLEKLKIVPTTPKETGFAYLKKKEWPTDVAREAVTELYGGEAVGRIAA